MSDSDAHDAFEKAYKREITREKAFNERAASGAASGATAVLYTALGSQVEIRTSSRDLQLLVRRWIFWRKMMKKLMQLRRWLLYRRKKI